MRIPERAELWCVAATRRVAVRGAAVLSRSTWTGGGPGKAQEPAWRCLIGAFGGALYAVSPHERIDACRRFPVLLSARTLKRPEGRAPEWERGVHAASDKGCDYSLALPVLKVIRTDSRGTPSALRKELNWPRFRWNSYSHSGFSFTETRQVVRCES